MINCRVAQQTTLATVSVSNGVMPILCAVCVSGRGECFGTNSCSCRDGFYGRICDKSIIKMSSDTVSDSKRLKPFQVITLEESYESGDKSTQFEVRSATHADVLFIANEADGRDLNLLFREDRGDRSNILYVNQWDNGVKYHKLQVERKWLGVVLINLSPDDQDVELKMSRLRSRVFNVVSMILYILMIVAITLLLVLSICVACLKGRNRNRVQAANAAEISAARQEQANEKLTELEINRCLPFVTADPKLSTDICSICLDTFGDKQLRKVILCGHQFHANCIIDWTKMKENCPNCNKDYSRKALLEFEHKQKIMTTVEEKPLAKPGTLISNEQGRPNSRAGEDANGNPRQKIVETNNPITVTHLAGSGDNLGGQSSSRELSSNTMQSRDLSRRFTKKTLLMTRNADSSTQANLSSSRIANNTTLINSTPSGGNIESSLAELHSSPSNPQSQHQIRTASTTGLHRATKQPTVISETSGSTLARTGTLTQQKTRTRPPTLQPSNQLNQSPPSNQLNRISRGDGGGSSTRFLQKENGKEDEVPDVQVLHLD
jgi:hypothetical protein